MFNAILCMYGIVYSALGFVLYIIIWQLYMLYSLCVGLPTTYAYCVHTTCLHATHFNHWCNSLIPVLTGYGGSSLSVPKVHRWPGIRYSQSWSKLVTSTSNVCPLKISKKENFVKSNGYMIYFNIIIVFVILSHEDIKLNSSMRRDHILIRDLTAL